jgi:acetyl-CoA synthetase
LADRKWRPLDHFIGGSNTEKASYAMFPMPGIQPALMDENGKEIEGNDVTGNLCIKFLG